MLRLNAQRTRGESLCDFRFQSSVVAKQRLNETREGITFTDTAGRLSNKDSLSRVKLGLYASNHYPEPFRTLKSDRGVPMMVILIISLRCGAPTPGAVSLHGALAP